MGPFSASQRTRQVGQSGFTLIELVVVVLVLGIIAAVVAPRLMDYVGSAEESTARQNLGILRDAISNYRTRTGAYPGDLGTEADLKADLADYLNKFPENPLKEKDTVAVQTTGAPLTTTVGGPIGSRYDNVTGQVILNSNGTASDGSAFVDW